VVSHVYVVLSPHTDLFSGTQAPIQFSPDRWIIIHSLLGLVTRYAADVKNMFPSSVEFNKYQASEYPRTRILRGDAEEKLLDPIFEHICRVGISGFLSIARQPSEIRQTILRYIRQPNLTPADVDAVEKGTFFTETTKGPLLLLRGLIAGGVLSFALKSKRWRVNYGIGSRPQAKNPVSCAIPLERQSVAPVRVQSSGCGHHAHVTYLLLWRSR
jgi:hypothetical protein